MYYCAWQSTGNLYLQLLPGIPEKEVKMRERRAIKLRVCVSATRRRNCAHGKNNGIKKGIFKAA
jgi:hypothetical protein